MSISRAKVQAFGGFLTAMVIPNMGAFITWGFITALFIPTGWLPNDEFGTIVGPMITYLLPMLLAYNGGKLVAGDRGAIAGVVGTFGLIVGSTIPMFLGAMIIGPVSGYIIKKFDQLVDGKIPTGFEMVVNNFSLGIIGLFICLASYSIIGPAILEANNLVTAGIEALVSTGFLPLLSLINEPAKVLFLNNVIDQGIYYPLGMQEALEAGKSIYFMVASNPGSGLGLLLAYSMFGTGMAKKSSPSAMIIHFFGGIHEIYFPYVLMKPIMIIPMIIGGATGTFIFDLLGTGLVAGPSPGSIFAYIALTPPGNFLGMALGVIGACAATFATASLILKTSKRKDDEYEKSAIKAKEMKQEGKAIFTNTFDAQKLETISKIIFACDAGMGSSVLGANAFKRKLKSANIDVDVAHCAIEKIPEGTDVVVTHKNLVSRVRLKYPDIKVVEIENYLQDPSLEELYVKLAG